MAVCGHVSQSESLAVIYRILAELVMALHFAFIAFVAVGSLLAVRWPGLLWVHVPVLLWAVAIVTIGFTCPLTPLEQHLREQAGAASYEGGFIDHYLEDVVYPGRFTNLARLVVGALVITGYVLWWRRRPSRSSS